MKKIFVFVIFVFLHFASLAATLETMVIELGDSVKIQKISDKIWIENPKIAQAIPNDRGLLIKGLAIGSSKIRIDKTNKILTVLPAGQIQAYLDWKKLSYQFADVSVGSCDHLVCLNGKISTLKEFEKIIFLMQQNNAYVYLGLNLTESLKKQIERWYEIYLRNHGMGVKKIIFDSIWTTYSANDGNYNKTKLEFEKIGIYQIEDKQKLALSDNLRVEIKVVEIKKELVRRLGIKWPDSYAASLLNLKSDGANTFDLMVNASENSGDMNILASPNLMCKSGKEATFFAGGEFPIKSIGEKFSSVAWKSYGINLKIKPQIDSIGQISLEIESEISSIDKSREIDGVPALHTHKVTSHFDLVQSKTIILSGLIKKETGSSSQGLPFLSEIPILGRLFSSKDYLDNKTELVIFVTPKLSE